MSQLFDQACEWSLISLVCRNRRLLGVKILFPVDHVLLQLFLAALMLFGDLLRYVGIPLFLQLKLRL